MTAENIKESTRLGIRYPSPQGELGVEQLWQLPLTAIPPKNPNGSEKADLDKVAKAINAELKSITEESFVKTSSNPRVGILTIALEVVKYIITYKQEEAKAKADKQAIANDRAVLVEAYEAQKRDELVKGKSSEELLAALKALDSQGPK